MKNGRVSWVVALALICSLGLVASLFSQITKDPATKQDRIDGTIQSIDTKASTIAIRQRGNANFFCQVVYDKATQFTYRNKPSTFDEVREGRRIICLGKAESPNKMTATRIDIRDK
jgi:hypothetical protein